MCQALTVKYWSLFQTLQMLRSTQSTAVCGTCLAARPPVCNLHLERGNETRHSLRKDGRASSLQGLPGSTETGASGLGLGHSAQWALKDKEVSRQHCVVPVVTHSLVPGQTSGGLPCVTRGQTRKAAAYKLGAGAVGRGGSQDSPQDPRGQEERSRLGVATLAWMWATGLGPLNLKGPTAKVKGNAQPDAALVPPGRR